MTDPVIVLASNQPDGSVSIACFEHHNQKLYAYKASHYRGGKIGELNLLRNVILYKKLT